jgi:Zn finger protein HypA/HybF involved in hydrogenase expression
MHEAGIAQSLIHLAAESVSRRRQVTISRVGIRVGECAGVVPDFLRACFDSLKEDTILARSELLIYPAEASVLQLAFVEWEENAPSAGKARTLFRQFATGDIRRSDRAVPNHSQPVCDPDEVDLPAIANSGRGVCHIRYDRGGHAQKAGTTTCEPSPNK